MNKQTEERTDLVTTSLLELPIAAKNLRRTPKNNQLLRAFEKLLLFWQFKPWRSHKLGSLKKYLLNSVYLWNNKIKQAEAELCQAQHSLS